MQFQNNKQSKVEIENNEIEISNFNEDETKLTLFFNNGKIKISFYKHDKIFYDEYNGGKRKFVDLGDYVVEIQDSRKREENDKK